MNLGLQNAIDHELWGFDDQQMVYNLNGEDLIFTRVLMYVKLFYFLFKVIDAN